MMWAFGVFLSLLACTCANGTNQTHSLQASEPIDLQLLLFNVSASQRGLTNELQAIKEMISQKVDQLRTEVKMNHGADVTTTKTAFRHCADVYRKLSKEDGVYQITPEGTTVPFSVYCDMTNQGGGWTVFQRRGDYYGSPSDNFYRSWQEYKQGFGDLNREFWLGNDKLALMTKEDVYELLVDLTDVDGTRVYAKYNRFKIEDEYHRYRLNIGYYTGNAGNSLSRHNGMRFSTKDRDYDESHARNCAQLYRGAWWYSNCHDSNLNGLNLKGPHRESGKGIEWGGWKNEYYSIYQTEMKFRPKNF